VSPGASNSDSNLGPPRSSGIAPALEEILGVVRAMFDARHAAREEALVATRQIIQHSAGCIRAVHRREFDNAEALLAQATVGARRAQTALADHSEIYHAGFLHDALKELAEASLTLAVITGRPLPTPEDLGVEYPAYLNGLAETVGELRRFALDSLRHGERDRAESLLDAMDEIYGLLVTFDYPDAITRGLRRHTDMVRGVTERTRGDLTLVAVQQELETRIAALQQRLDEDHLPD
jgi:translin